MKTETIVDSLTPLETRPLVWKGETVPDYYIRNDGMLFHHEHACRGWKLKGRNYSTITINGKRCTYRHDYMVACTFKGFPDDVIRLVHINNDIADDRIDNLMWVRKIDIQESYKDLVLLESDGSIIEEWRPCKIEYNPTLGYEVSNLGLIRDKDHKLIQLKENYGYLVFYYLDANYAKQTRMKAVHRAVAEAFIPNPNNYDIVNHIDGNPMNNVILNLEWTDDSMNAEHAYLTGLNESIRYTNSEISLVCQLLAQGCPHVQISLITGVDRKTISDIYRGRRHRDISSQFTMPEKRWPAETKSKVKEYICQGKKGRDIAALIDRPYDQSFISLYERMRRELRSAGRL